MVLIIWYYTISLCKLITVACNTNQWKYGHNSCERSKQWEAEIQNLSSIEDNSQQKLHARFSYITFVMRFICIIVVLKCIMLWIFMASCFLMLSCMMSHLDSSHLSHTTIHAWSRTVMKCPLKDQACSKILTYMS